MFIHSYDGGLRQRVRETCGSVRASLFDGRSEEQRSDLHHQKSKNRENAQDDGNPAELNDHPGQQVKVSACGSTRAG